MAEPKKPLTDEAKAKYLKAAAAMKASAEKVKKIAAGIASLDKDVESLDKALD